MCAAGVLATWRGRPWRARDRDDRYRPCQPVRRAARRTPSPASPIAASSAAPACGEGAEAVRHPLQRGLALHQRRGRPFTSRNSSPRSSRIGTSRFSMAMCFSLASSRSAAERMATMASACRPSARATRTMAAWRWIRPSPCPVRVLRLVEGVPKRLELLNVTAGTARSPLCVARSARPKWMIACAAGRCPAAPTTRRLGPAAALDDLRTGIAAKAVSIGSRTGEL